MQRKFLLFLFGRYCFGLWQVPHRKRRLFPVRQMLILNRSFRRKTSAAPCWWPKNGKVIYLKAFGMASESLKVPTNRIPKYHIAFFIQKFHGAAILLLEERGRFAYQWPFVHFHPRLTPMAIRSLFIICLLILPAYPILIICPNMLTCLFTANAFFSYWCFQK